MSKSESEYAELLAKLIDANENHIKTNSDYIETCKKLIKVLNENFELKVEIRRLQNEKVIPRQD